MEAFDERLCNLKLQPANNRLHVEAATCWRRAHAEIRQRGNLARLCPAFVDFHIEAIRKYLEEIDRVFREVLLLDGKPVTPEFIRTILVPRVFTIIAARKGSIQHELERRSTFTRADTGAGRHYLVRAMSRLQSEMANRYEVEAIELGKQRARAAAGSAARVSTGVSFNALSDEGRVADLWREFHNQFQSLADEELKVGVGQREQPLNAHYTYAKHTEILGIRSDARSGFALFANSEKLADVPATTIEVAAFGPFCLLETPKYGLWTISGGASESLHERFRAVATRAGVVLEAPLGTDPEDIWLHRLLCDLRENKSKRLFADNGEVGIIVHLCEASAIFCSRLERRALTQELSRFQARGDTLPKILRESVVLPLLRAKGWSTLDWAQNSRVDYNTARNYLKGKTAPYQSTLKKLADSIGLSVDKMPR